MDTKQALAKLREPFDESCIEWRVQKAGLKNGSPWARILAYVDARAIQNRLDDVLGAENWQVHYERKEAGFLCNLTLRINNEWISKCDGSEDTDIEPFKGGISKALVRAASVWGIARYLYDKDAEWATFVDQGTAGAREARIENQYFYWIPNSQNTQNTPSRPPANTHTQAAASGDPGEWVVPFGTKTKGRKLKDIPKDEALSFADWLSAKAKTDNKPLQGNAKSFVDKANQYFSAPKASEVLEEDLPF